MDFSTEMANHTLSVKINETGTVEFVGGGESTSSSDDDELCECQRVTEARLE